MIHQQAFSFLPLVPFFVAVVGAWAAVFLVFALSSIPWWPS